MRLDPKYFVPFLVIMALAAALLIAYFTVSTQQSQRRSFEARVMAQDTLRQERFPVLGSEDSLSVTDFRGRYVVLDFWSTWSNFSEESHIQLAGVAEENPDRLKVLAAVVEDQRDKVQAYIDRNSFPFQYVDGTKVFNEYGVPGVPTQLVYNPEGRLVKVFFGNSDPSRYDRLRTLISNE